MVPDVVCVIKCTVKIIMFLSPQPQAELMTVLLSDVLPSTRDSPFRNTPKCPLGVLSKK